MGMLMKTRKAGVVFEGHWGRKMAEGPLTVAGRILGRWRIEGNEPCRACEEDGEKMGSRNLLERKRGFAPSQDDKVFFKSRLYQQIDSQVG